MTTQQWAFYGFERRMGPGPLGVAAGAPTFPTLPGMLEYWEADSGVHLSGANITSVDGKMGAYALTASGTVPYNATSAYNSKPAFDFAVGNDAALFVNSFGIGTGGGLQVFIVGRMGSSTGSFGGAVSYGFGGGSDFNTSGAAAVLTRDDTNAGINTTDALTGGLANTMSADANHRFGIIYASTGPTGKAHYVDNVIGSNTSGVGITFVSNGTLVIGNRYVAGAIGGSPWGGPICGVYVGNATEWDSTNRSDFNTYAVAKWGS